jgi:acyl carrier protein
MHLDVRQWCQAHPAAVRSSLFKEHQGQHPDQSHQGTPPGRSIRDELMGIDSGKQRRTVFETHVRQEVSQVLRLAPSRIPLDKPLRTLGLDSLMSIELRNRLENSLHIPLSATLIWNYPTVRLLTSFLAEKIGVVFETEDQHAEGPSDIRTVPEVEEGNPPDSEIENLSKAELDALLKEESDAIEDLLGDD